MLRRFLKIVAFTLVLMIFVEIIPISASSQVIENLSLTNETEDTQGTTDIEEGSSEDILPEILYEMTSLRTENSKTYLMSDGTCAIASYEEAVHYKDENDLWADIDNTLVYKVANARTVSGAEYVNTANDFSIKFSEAVTNDKHVEISKDDYSLSWKYLPNTNVTLNNVVGNIADGHLQVDTVLTYEEEFNSKLALNNNKSEFIYENIEDNIDLEYMIEGSSIKENIILASRQDSYVFKMRLYTENLVAVIDEFGGIELNDSVSGENVFYIPKPYMYDAGCEFSESVYFTLTNDNEGYILSVTADEEWINSEERVFPVVVDPEVETSGAGTDVTAICQYTYNDSDFLTGSGVLRQAVGKNDTYGAVQNIWNVTLPELPEGCVVQSAILSTYQKIINTTTQEPKIVYLTEAEKGFDENSTRSWNWYYDGLADPTEEREIIDYSIAGNTYAKADYDLTRVVKEWYNEEKEKGWIMFNYEKQFSEESNDKAFIRIASNAYETDTTVLPSLLITYANTYRLFIKHPQKNLWFIATNSLNIYFK